ncbi:hypothetical protein E3T40_07100 [Cryobacterium sp. TMT1-19]|uniref:AAA family ATPase n=1 Tax=Cryobacterium sp. TMT1-19 TaxID=1259231 RepID=UPI00106AFD8B|nr:AAA family ATPase [Cryobacterium sp. TMT1-19]TFD35917.1 hypothetical protein E3T40_07100 [Cryobacterium sp. TMT1-19]
MIKVQRLHVRNFRGIRTFDFDLAGRNFAVAGRNGTGKSGVIDAIEFALTGTVSRLSGHGTRSVSVKAHAPHVDFANEPQSSFVTMVFTIPGLEGDISVTRSVKDATKPVLTPNSAEAKAALEWAGIHPEFALTRREIVSFILAEGKGRADVVQALLRLEKITKTRTLLQKIANADAKDAKAQETQLSVERVALQSVAGSPMASEDELRVEVDILRTELDLPPLSGQMTRLNIVQGVEKRDSQTGPSAYRAQWLKDLDGLSSQLMSAGPGTLVTDIDTVIATASTMSSDTKLILNIQADSFLRDALDMFDGEHCPACGTEWDASDFRENVLSKRGESETAAASVRALGTRAVSLLPPLRQIYAVLAVVDRFKAMLPGAADLSRFAALEPDVKNLGVALAGVRGPEELGRLAVSAPLSLNLISDFEIEVRKLVEALPVQSDQDALRVRLHLIADRKESYDKAFGRFKTAQSLSTQSGNVFKLFDDSARDGLSAIYKKVQQLFARLYAIVNHDDEGDFSAALTPNGPALDMQVAFYDKGMHPPGAYHSEGHQDAMGLCLYLALMKHTLGASFTFAALDDVLMSIDSGHRGSVGKMLLEEFPETQFIITTHDEQWMRQMKSQGLVTKKNLIHFRDWNVDNGPVNWASYDPWTEVEAYVATGDVRGAAASLRSYLEYVSRELCENLDASVRYRSDGHNTLGELLPKTVSALRETLRKGKASANSWNKSDEIAKLDAWDTSILDAYQRSQVEEWPINAALHFNAWASFERVDFVTVVEAMRSLVEQFRCVDCLGFVSLTGNESGRTGLTCPCSTKHINLTTKPTLTGQANCGGGR